MKLLQKSIKTVNSSRGWVAFVVFVFLVGIINGAIISLVNPDLSREFFRKYGESLQKIDFNSGLNTSFLIFQRNAAILIGSFVFGIFGVVPIFVTFINGMVFGMYFGFREIYSTFSIVKILFLIVPHGVFEITASLIGFGLSVKTGLHWLLVKSKRRETFLTDFRSSLQAGVFVIVLLAIAALIEGIVTPSLTCFLFSICF